MPGPDFTQETQALNDAETQLHRARTEFTESIAAQCEPNITAWAKSRFLSHPQAAAKLSDAALRNLRDRVDYLALKIAEAIRELAHTPDWPVPAELPPAMPPALVARYSGTDYQVGQSLEEQVSQYVEKINKDVDEAGLFAANPSSISPQPFGGPVSLISEVRLAGPTIWGTFNDKPLIDAANAVIARRRDLKDAQETYLQQTLSQRWDAATPGNGPE